MWVKNTLDKILSDGNVLREYEVYIHIYIYIYICIYIYIRTDPALDGYEIGGRRGV